MPSQKCPRCGQTASHEVRICPRCGRPLERSAEGAKVIAAGGGTAVAAKPALYGMRSLKAAARAIGQAEPVPIRSSTLKRFGWFTLANLAIALSLSLISGGLLLPLLPVALLIGTVGPFFWLALSRWMAVHWYGVELIDPQNPADREEADLYRLVESLSRRAGLKVVPDVGWYESDEMNAFATGMSRNRSLIAFSTGLLEQMDADGIAAVAAHEVAHIANGDMVTMTLVESAVNAIVLVFTLPLWVLKLVALFSDEVDWAVYWMIWLVHRVVSVVLLFLGSLVVLAFSRHREFAADRLAALLVSKEAVIHALETLAEDDVKPSREDKALAAFKIKAPPAWWDLLSTHPSIERRIAALEAME